MPCASTHDKSPGPSSAQPRLLISRCARWTVFADRPGTLSAQESRPFTEMVCGQRAELIREDWSLRSYVRLCYATGGRQLEVYFRAAAQDADADSSLLVSLADPFGLPMHTLCDVRSNDSRIVAFGAGEIDWLWRQEQIRLRAALARHRREFMACRWAWRESLKTSTFRQRSAPCVPGGVLPAGWVKGA